MGQSKGMLKVADKGLFSLPPALTKIAFIVNPAAGGGRGRRRWDILAQALRRSNKTAAAGFTVFYTERPGHGTGLARQAAESGYERVAAAGGDGTISEIVNGLVGTGAALGVVPIGTGNDFARGAGLPADPLRAAETVISGSIQKIDLGLINEKRYFINIAGIGFDAEVARAVNEYPKVLGGTLPYLAGILKTLWSFSPALMRVKIDLRELRQKVFLLAVANATTYGGGLKICPDARIDDGLFDICVAGEIGRLEIPVLLPKIYQGGHRHHPKVKILRARQIEVHPSRLVAIHADGELIESQRFYCEIVPRAIDLIIPPAGGIFDGGREYNTGPARSS